ncbi:tRNA (cytosine(38)-C(5))-methyltransferase [Bacillus rossius redtenbacheri]|uniref:tRNA (cytosine(38)-C(5))-methyltransferase n=1 Tax=Bacillus rossius redtenbacheri TaxID=93214 RepID=UPI002FDDC189
MKVLELFSGIGGMHYALKECDINSTVKMAIDINTVANHVYRHNFPQTKLLSRNILSLSAEEINNLNIDMILMSPPCQPFTRVGLKKDVADDRSSPLLHIIKVLPNLKDPFKYVLVENVKGFELSEARNRLVQAMLRIDFVFQEFILSPSQLSIPNSRHRYYLIAKPNTLPFCFQVGSLMEHLPELKSDDCERTVGIRRVISGLRGRICSEVSTASDTGCLELRHFLENELDDVHLEGFLLPDKLLSRHFPLLDLVGPRSARSCCFTKAYGRYVEGTGSVLCPAPPPGDLLGLAGDLPRLKALRLRYFTDREVARLMCFPECFGFPEDVTWKQRYRLLGNSVNVHVVALLIALLVA